MAMQLGRNICRYCLAGPFRAASGASFTRVGTPLAHEAARHYGSVPLAKDRAPPRITPTGNFLRFVGGTFLGAGFCYWVDEKDYRKNAEDRKANNQKIRQEAEELEALLESKRQETEKLQALLESKRQRRSD